MKYHLQTNVYRVGCKTSSAQDILDKRFANGEIDYWSHSIVAYLENIGK